MAKVESTDDNLYDGLYGDEFEEDFAVSALGNPTALTDPSGDVTPTEFLEPPPDDPSFATPTTTTTTSASTTTTTTLPLETDVAQPIPTLDSSRTRSSADATLPPKPNSNGAGTPLSYSAQVAEQFSSSYRQTPSQERVRLDAARLAQFNQTGAPSGSPTTSTASAALAASGGAVVIIDGQARPVRPSEMKDEGKMFVGGLSWDTTDEGLRNYFSEFGKVDACTIVRDADGKSRGFAFLTFEDPASVNAVMIREHFLDGKAIDPKRAIPREEHLRNTRYFVGGLAPQTTADSMRTFFTNFGKVVDATVMVDRETGRSKGFGFVTFEDNSNDSQLVGKLGLILDDKQIEVKTAQPRSQRDQQRHNVASPGNNFNAGQAAVGNPAAMGGSMPFMAMNNTGAGDMSMMYQRMMNGMGTPYGAMMGGGMGMMGGFNPMMGMGMGMGRFGMGGMGGMSGGGVAGMTPMAAATAGGMAGNMGMGGGVGGMRLGMGPIGMGGASGGGMGGGMVAGGGMGAAAAAAAAMAGAGGGMGGMGMRQTMGGMMGGGAGRGGRPGMNQGPGPARITNRGQHGYHPYAR